VTLSRCLVIEGLSRKMRKMTTSYQFFTPNNTLRTFILLCEDSYS
jgi:hypothetical protein